MSTYIDKPMSLVERKKLQWAKEREELAGLCAPWSSHDQFYDKPFGKTRPLTKLPSTTGDIQRSHAQQPPRRSSLPPLCKNQYNSFERETGGDTSGYGSDITNQNERVHQTMYWHQSGYDSSSSYREDRSKWQAKYWEAKEETYEKLGNEPPNWVKRGLQREEEIVVSNTSPAESPEGDPARPCTNCSVSNKTYIRGQNVPLDSEELAERERKRQIALEHQEAIRQQLEEREKRKQLEKERRIREEKEEELRIEREQEIERKRKEAELKAIKEKQEKERKRKEAIREALELAEKEAQLQKSRARRNVNINEDTSNVKEIQEKPAIETEKNNNNINKEENNNLVIISPKPEVLNNEINNTPQPIRVPKIENTREYLEKIPQQPSPRSDNFTLVLPGGLEGLQGVQYAVLLPYPTQPNSPLPIAVPINFGADSTNRTQNRVLTPTQYRSRGRKLCDSSTQTDPVEIVEPSSRHKDKPSNRKGSRGQGENRPKWGANRPPTRYMKQSEKDPLYQRRKLRQKMRDYKNSSDESQMGSPRTYREKRHARALWRKNDHFLTRNIRMYQTEIVPLELDKDQIFYRQGDSQQFCCHCNCGNRVEVLKINTPEPKPEDVLQDNSSAEKTSQDQLGKEDWEPSSRSMSSSTRNTENN